MITYITIHFNSEGAKPSEVVSRLHMMGFRPTTGSYDFKYEWDMKATWRDAVALADKVHATLKGFNVLFKLETV